MSGRLGPKDSVQHCSVSLAFQLKALACNSSRDNKNFLNEENLEIYLQPCRGELLREADLSTGLSPAGSSSGCTALSTPPALSASIGDDIKIEISKSKPKDWLRQRNIWKRTTVAIYWKNLCKSIRWSLPLFLGRWRFLWSSRHMHRLAWVKQELHI